MEHVRTIRARHGQWNTGQRKKFNTEVLISVKSRGDLETELSMVRMDREGKEAISLVSEWFRLDNPGQVRLQKSVFHVGPP